VLDYNLVDEYYTKAGISYQFVIDENDFVTNFIEGQYKSPLVIKDSTSDTSISSTFYYSDDYIGLFNNIIYNIINYI